jgi:hypothetical protein
MIGNATLRTASDVTLAKARHLATSHEEQDVRDVAQELITLSDVVRSHIEEIERHFPSGSAQHNTFISRR